jgi:hypothetical protein
MVRGSASARPGEQDVGFQRSCRGFACYRGPRQVVVSGRFAPPLATSCSMSAVWDGAGSYGREASLERITAATTAGSDERHFLDPSGLLSRVQPPQGCPSDTRSLFQSGTESESTL